MYTVAMKPTLTRECPPGGGGMLTGRCVGKARSKHRLSVVREGSKRRYKCDAVLLKDSGRLSRD
jgi:hypothetical protein